MSDFASRDATEAARRIARHLGLGEVEPAILAVSEHASLHLRPAAVVARVKPAAGLEGMRRELEVVRYLAEQGAPVVPPLADAGPFMEDGWAITLWQWVPHRSPDGDNACDQALAAASLRRIHRAFADYPGSLPAFEDKIEACRVLLEEAPMPALAAADRRFLAAAGDTVSASLRGLPPNRVPLHGDAGFHNLFMTEDDALWSDFESACLGPPGWDFAAMGYEDVPVLSAARSFCVAVWCWAQADLSGKRDAAVYHLDVLRRLSA